MNGKRSYWNSPQLPLAAPYSQPLPPGTFEAFTANSEAANRQQRFRICISPDAKGCAGWAVVSGLNWPFTMQGIGGDAAHSAQTTWLRLLRQHFGGWIVLDLLTPSGSLPAKSRRTWEGWEGGRPIPFFHAAELAASALKEPPAHPVGQQDAKARPITFTDWDRNPKDAKGRFTKRHQV